MSFYVYIITVIVFLCAPLQNFRFVKCKEDSLQLWNKISEKPTDTKQQVIRTEQNSSSEHPRRYGLRDFIYSVAKAFQILVPPVKSDGDLDDVDRLARAENTTDNPSNGLIFMDIHTTQRSLKPKNNIRPKYTKGGNIQRNEKNDEKNQVKIEINLKDINRMEFGQYRDDEIPIFSDVDNNASSIKGKDREAIHASRQNSLMYSKNRVTRTTTVKYFRENSEKHHLKKNHKSSKNLTSGAKKKRKMKKENLTHRSKKHKKKKKEVIKTKTTNTLRDESVVEFVTVLVPWPEKKKHEAFNKHGNVNKARGKPLKIDMKDLFSPYSIAMQLDSIRKKKHIARIAEIEQEVIGRTAEFNDIVIWKISEYADFYNGRRALDDKKYAVEVKEKKIIFIVHALNTMGWQFLPGISRISEFTKLLFYYLENLDEFDIFLIPMANPDGVSKLKQSNSFHNYRRVDTEWNKNQSPQKNCPGVALDRNFDVAWNISLNVTSCNPLYPGPEPFSEHETRAIREIFHKHGHNMVAYIHVHGGTFDSKSFKGDAVLYPKGYTVKQTDDDKYIDLQGEIDEALGNASFKIASVAVDTLYNWYGRVGGTSVDYAATIYGIPYAMELVMQVYNDELPPKDEKTLDVISLTEIWQVVLDVIFDQIYKTEVKT